MFGFNSLTGETLTHTKSYFEITHSHFYKIMFLNDTHTQSHICEKNTFKRIRTHTFLNRILNHTHKILFLNNTLTPLENHVFEQLTPKSHFKVHTHPKTHFESTLTYSLTIPSLDFYLKVYL